MALPKHGYYFFFFKDFNLFFRVREDAEAEEGAEEEGETDSPLSREPETGFYFRTLRS